MDALFGSPGMIAVAAFVFVVQGLSLLLLILNVRLFRMQKAKYEVLLAKLGDETALGTPGRFLVPTYVAATLVATGVIIAIFVFQPHIL
jgi:hypothetical protein